MNKVHAFVGSETGLLKSINFSSKSWSNVNKPQKCDRQTMLTEQQVKSLSWFDMDSNTVSVGTANCSIFVFDSSTLSICEKITFEKKLGELVALDSFENKHVFATSDGKVHLYDSNLKNEETLLFSTGESLDVLRRRVDSNNLGTGGKKNDFKLWNIERPEQPIFRAKNVRNDFLNLEVPVWVTDIAYLPSSEKIACSSAYHKVNIFDPKAQRRPVLTVEFGENPIKSMCVAPNDNQVLVGNTIGDMALLDFRGKGHVVQKYKGGAGSIRGVACHKSQNVVVSCGLDRMLRIHDVASRKLLHKFYLKSRLTCLLLSQKDFSLDDVAATEGDAQEDDVTAEDVWQNLEEVEEEKKTKRKLDKKDERRSKVAKVK